ncbi:MAG: transposase [Spirochaetaceae bacterium]|nr:transposase [Spirochaetaceae bacterium]
MKTLTGNDRPLEEALVEGDTGYFTEKNLKEAEERKIEVIIPDQQFRKRDEHFDGRPEHGGKGRFTAEDFAYDDKGNSYRYPAGKELCYKGYVKLNRNSGEKYQAKSGDCKECALRQRCIASRGGKSPKRTLYIVDRSEGNLCEEMRKKIDEAKCRALYGRRMQIIELCFSDMSYCKGMDRFSLRTKIKVNIQWMLYCMVHNIGKCMPRIAEGGGG